MMSHAEKLAEFVTIGSQIRLGQLTLSRNENGHFVAHHKMDDETAEGELNDLSSEAAVEEMAQNTADGKHRPLRTAPTLQCGWIAKRETSQEFLALLDIIYPAAVATWFTYHAGTSVPVPLRETLNRQSGMNSQAGTITDQDANRIMRELCGQGCLRKISWPIDDRCACSRIGPIRNRIPLICLEACTFAIEAAREIAGERMEETVESR